MFFYHETTGNGRLLSGQSINQLIFIARNDRGEADRDLMMDGFMVINDKTCILSCIERYMHAMLCMYLSHACMHRTLVQCPFIDSLCKNIEAPWSVVTGRLDAWPVGRMAGWTHGLIQVYRCLYVLECV